MHFVFQNLLWIVVDQDLALDDGEPVDQQQFCARRRTDSRHEFLIEQLEFDENNLTEIVEFCEQQCTNRRSACTS